MLIIGYAAKSKGRFYRKLSCFFAGSITLHAFQIESRRPAPQSIDRYYRIYG
jgi:hypothetical protein